MSVFVRVCVCPSMVSTVNYTLQKKIIKSKISLLEVISGMLLAKTLLGIHKNNKLVT